MRKAECFIANDGNLFTSAEDCAHHEQCLVLQTELKKLLKQMMGNAQSKSYFTERDSEVINIFFLSAPNQIAEIMKDYQKCVNERLAEIQSGNQK